MQGPLKTNLTSPNAPHSVPFQTWLTRLTATMYDQGVFVIAIPDITESTHDWSITGGAQRSVPVGSLIFVLPE